MKKPYTPLPGLGTGRGSFQVGLRHRLYQATDHLLLVQSTGYTEEYRRIFYRDIRYVVIRRNQRYLWTSALMAAILLIIFSLRLLSAPWLGLALFGVPFALILIVNLIRGPSCSCYLATQVQTIAVPTPQRLRKVPLLLDFLKTKVPSPPGETADP